MATTRDYEQRLTNAAADLDHVRGAGTDGSARSPLAQARANLHTWAGHGAGRTGYTGSRGGGGHDLSDRVADAVDAGRSLTSDEHAQALADLDKQTIRVEHELARLRKLVDAATTTKPTAAKITTDAVCRVCSTVGYSPAVYARGLCRWCYDQTDMLTPGGIKDTPDADLITPATAIALKHCQGKRIYENDWDTHHPDRPQAKRPTVCGQPTFIDGQTGTCSLPIMHEGRCTPGEV